MKKVALLLLSMLFITTTYSQNIQGESGLRSIYEHCRALLLSDTAYATEQSYLLTDEVKYTTDGAGYFKLLAADGTWKDIDYREKQPAAWMPANHLYRILQLARTYYKNHDAAYLDAIHRAAAFWMTNDIQCTNWWQNQINTPFVFSSLVIMLDKDANARELAYLNDVLAKRVPLKNPTGQNLIWQLDNQARIALIHQDYEAFAESITNMQSVITVSTKEGIQPDYSFHQHGAMLQFGNYGLHFVNSLLFWMTITANTPVAFAPDKQQILFDYCSKGLRWTIFKGGMDITAIGRQFREDCDTKRGSCLFADFNLLKSFDKKDPCKYAMDGLSNALACDLTANKGFWRSAYMVTLARDQYMMSVKMHGSLVKRVESINGDNLRGAFINDGVTLIQHTGKEYHNIQPLWNWRMLPGVTGDTTINPEVKETMTTSNISAFVGQVSDGKRGISTMVYNRLGVKAYKSDFLADGMMIALGAGISSADKTNLVTTVNQTYAHGKPYIQSAKGQQLIWHDGVAYIFPEKDTPVKTRIKCINGNWINVDKGSGDVPVADSILTLYIPHRYNDKYVYIAKPAVNLTDAKKLAGKIPVTILANTSEIQAIKVNGEIMAVFYAPGSVTINKKEVLQSDSPCVLMYKPGGPVWVSDPSRKLQTVILTVGQHNISIKLPSGDYAGSSVKADL